MKERYIELMDRTLDAYTREHIERYFADVRRDGLTEHGFPRLTANIGILIAKGRRRELLPLFIEMMDLCCESFSRNVKAANDFSVKEILFCIRELIAADTVERSHVDRWLSDIGRLDRTLGYNVYARHESDKVHNWAAFTACSEQLRQVMGLCDSRDFIDVQVASQLQWLDGNGMYRDPNNPMVYDLVTRGLFSVLLFHGYEGKYREAMDAALRSAGLHTLRLQSVSGEISFGGRSNQFLHNEAHHALICEYEARRYAAEGNLELAGKFKTSARLAIDNVEYWLSEPTVRHIKNRFPLSSGHGCENYAYFDKYMITVASFLYVAYLFCDDGIEPAERDFTPYAYSTSEDFHKLVLSASGYTLEFDTDADRHYDSTGLGRIHRVGAPSWLCLSCPATDIPNYRLISGAPRALSIVHGKRTGGEWKFCTDGKYTVVRAEASDHHAEALIEDSLGIRGEYMIAPVGMIAVSIFGNFDGEVGLMLPAFVTDGEKESVIVCKHSELIVECDGWVCRYSTDGKISPLGFEAENRNGRYAAYVAHGERSVRLRMHIYKKDD